MNGDVPTAAEIDATFDPAVTAHPAAGGTLDAAAVLLAARDAAADIRETCDALSRQGVFPGDAVVAPLHRAQKLLDAIVAEAERDAALTHQVSVVTLRAAFLGGAEYRLDVLAEHLQDVPGLIDVEQVGVETRVLAEPYRGGPVFTQQEGGDA